MTKRMYGSILHTHKSHGTYIMSHSLILEDSLLSPRSGTISNIGSIMLPHWGHGLGFLLPESIVSGASVLTSSGFF